MFPKIIWQTHKWEYEDLPEIYKKTSLTWQKMNPDWEYKYIPNRLIRDQIAELQIPGILSFFDQSPDWLTKSDIYREVMVYAHGGLWADMDSACLEPISKSAEKNLDKEMVCAAPIFQFGINTNTWESETTEKSLEKILSGNEIGHWIPNNLFLGKKENMVSKEIINIITSDKAFSLDGGFMGLRGHLYNTMYKVMSLDLLCGFHDSRLNDRTQHRNENS